ncbi:MAG TPA: DNA-3-methyladenine glycosylase I, partial [Paracoccaceae bacterium]|nr:DNA-3-methyladenine glycosylase I [Paracoccaceae bacterium]
IRHRGKIEATIRAARLYLDLQEGPGFAPFLWEAVDGTPLQPHRRSMAEVPGATDASHALAKRLKAQGFAFCGPTIAYAFMQATGMVNDHLVTCPRHAAVAAMA